MGGGDGGGAGPADSGDLNKDVLSVQLEPPMLRELMTAVLSGTMSFESYFYNLKKGELYPPGTTVEEEQTRIDIEQAARGTGSLIDMPPRSNGFSQQGGGE